MCIAIVGYAFDGGPFKGGEGVKIMQEALGVSADGDFGPGTERALKEWQAANGLTADGIAGPATFAKLLD